MGRRGLAFATLTLLSSATAGFKCGGGGGGGSSGGSDGGAGVSPACFSDSDCSGGATCVPWGDSGTFATCTGTAVLCLPTTGGPSICACAELCTGPNNIGAVCGGYCQPPSTTCTSDSECPSGQTCSFASSACPAGQACTGGYCLVCREGDPSQCAATPCAFGDSQGALFCSNDQVCDTASKNCYGQSPSGTTGAGCDSSSSKCPVDQGCGLSGSDVVCIAKATCAGTCTPAGHPPPPPVDASTPDSSSGCTPAATPSIAEFTVQSTLGSGPTGIVLGPDGNLWFTLNSAYGTTNEGSGAAIGRMSPDGATSTAFALPTASSGPWAVAAGPDGKIWFTETSAGKIGHIDTDGTNATEITLPAANARPNAITAGPDGNMWFIEQGAGNIGWVSPSGGAVTEIPIPTANSNPTGITKGPDGRIWFVEAQGDNVGAIATTPGAKITEYPMGTHMGSQSIATGPDGNLWFTSFAGKGLGRSTTSGTVQVFPTGVSTWQVVPGADGNLWFAENESDAIGRMTPTGTVTSFPVPTKSSNVNGIATGPGGTIWFTEQGTGKIGRVTICQ